MRRRRGSRLSCRILTLLTGLLTTCVGVGGLRNVAVTVPTAVSPGDTVTLQCQYDLENDPLYTVKWYKGRQEFFRYIPKELPHTRVFPLHGINVDVSKSGANEVVLRDVQFHMAGKYRCEVSADAPSFHTSVVASYMHVVYLPEGDPKMVMEKQRYAVGEILRGNCTSSPSSPPTNLTWYINGKRMNESFLIRYPVDPIDLSHVGPLNQHNTIISDPLNPINSHNTLADNGGGFLASNPVNSATTNTNSGISIGIGPDNENHQRQVTVVGLELEIESSTFHNAKIRIECRATMFQLYTAKAEHVIEEEKPRLASVLGTRESSSLGASSQWSNQYIWIMALCLLASVASR